MDELELISIEPDKSVRYSKDSWNTEDYIEVERSIIYSCRNITDEDKVDPELEVKIDNLAFLLVNLKNYYSILSEYHHIGIQENSAIRSIEKDKNRIREMLDEFYPEEVSNITINFGYKGEPVKIENSIIVDKVFGFLRGLDKTDLILNKKKAEANVSKASVVFTDSCLVEIRDFLEEHTDAKRSKGDISNRQCRIIAKMFQAIGFDISKNESLNEKFIRRRFQLLTKKRTNN
ncbi:hypothetical protein [Ekhidna sp.]